MSAYTLTAEHSSLCPICCKYVVGGRSHISPLACPTPPNPQHSTYYADRGTWLIDNQASSRLHSRSWAHSRCIDALDKRLSHDEQIAMAGDWRVELNEKKREAQRADGHQNGRRRSAKRSSGSLS